MVVAEGKHIGGWLTESTAASLVQADEPSGDDSRFL